MFHHRKELVQELYIFSILAQIAGGFFGFYYGVFLYRNTFDLKILLIDLLVASCFSLIGYFLGADLIHKRGYMLAMRISLLFSSLAALVAFLFSQNIVDIFIYIAMIRGLASGIFASVTEIYLLREMTNKASNKYLYLNLSVEFLLTTIMPIIIGAIITYGSGYKTTFLMASVIYLIGVLIPKQYNKKPVCNYSLKDLLNVTQKTHFGEYGLNIFIGNGADQLNVFLIAIVPFLILKTEFSVGVLAGLAALIASVVSFYLKDARDKDQTFFGYTGAIGRLVGNLFLAIFWSTPILVIRGLFTNTFSAFNDPVFRKTQIFTAEKILGKDLNKDALELAFSSAFIAFLGKFSAVLIFLLILVAQPSSQASTIRWLLPIYGIWKIFDFYWMKSMHNRFGSEKTQLVSQPISQS